MNLWCWSYWKFPQGIIYSLLDKKQEAEEQFMTYRSLVPEEYPQRNFLDDVVIAAKAESREKLKEEVQNWILTHTSSEALGKRSV